MLIVDKKVLKKIICNSRKPDVQKKKEKKRKEKIAACGSFETEHLILFSLSTLMLIELSQLKQQVLWAKLSQAVSYSTCTGLPRYHLCYNVATCCFKEHVETCFIS